MPNVEIEAGINMPQERTYVPVKRHTRPWCRSGAWPCYCHQGQGQRRTRWTALRGLSKGRRSTEETAKTDIPHARCVRKEDRDRYEVSST